jgi:hypothetical protein
MGAPNLKLKAWRTRHGLTMEQAAQRVVVDGEPCTKATWHGWESAGKVPKPQWMLPLCELTGLEPNDFYERPDGGGRRPSRATGGGNGGSGPKPGNGGGGEPPQMALAL